MLRKQPVLVDRRAVDALPLLRAALPQPAWRWRCLPTVPISNCCTCRSAAPAFSDFVATDSARLITAVKKIGRVE
jgi:hypothetical protein